MGKQPYRVLQVVTIMNRGGIETMIMNLYRKIDREQIQFDFLVHRQEEGDYDDEIKQLGGEIYQAFPIRPWKYVQYFNWLNDFFNKHHTYIAVHSHIQENSGFVFKYASRYNIPNLICTSHTAGYGIDYKYLFRQFAKFYLNKYCTYKLACGEMAGKHLYGASADYKIFKNAIDLDKFTFNSDIRRKIRSEFGIEKKFVIGNVARFHPGKNHSFVIDIFHQICSTEKNATLMLVGAGEEEEQIKNKVKKLALTSKVIFTGLREDVCDLLQAFDVLLFPSLFEGIPVSIIEAQATGLPCILSNTIDPTTKITPNIEFYPLNAPISTWSDAVLSKKDFNRICCNQYIVDAGYDINIMAEVYHNLYISSL